MAKKNAKVSPVRQQYLEIKGQHPKAILFFRLGDFYETFDEDAQTVARELDIVLTSRNVSKGTRVPMAGVPHHAAENYLSRLIEKGYHVAICEQVGDEPVNGLMPREVVRIVTPGTIVEPGLLPSEANNYLASVIIDEQDAGVAYVDITTGEYAAAQLHSPDIWNAVRAELTRLGPAETLLPDTLESAMLPGHVTAVPSWRFEPGRSEEALLNHFEVAALDGFGLRDMPLAVRAAGGILHYLKETQPNALKLLTGLRAYSLNEFMTLDASTRRNLELTETIRHGAVQGSLLGVLDKSVTPMGKRLLRQWVSQPLLDVSQVQHRLDAVTFFFDDGLKRTEVREALKPLGDLERLTNRVVGATAQPRDLVAIRETLITIPTVMGLLPKNGSPLASFLENCSLCEEELSLLCSALADEPPATLQNTGVFREGYSEELDKVLHASRDARLYISTLETKERQRTGINTLKVGYNKVHGYYIEVTKAQADGVPEEYIRRQTLVNAERYITPEMKDYESQVLNADERIHAIEARLFRELCVKLGQSANRLLGTARALAALDVLCALAEVAAHEGFVCPQVVDEDILEVRDGRHPVVEHALSGGQRFVPNDSTFEEGERIRVITGPNMSGKSTYLRQVALIALMAQMGSYVPATAARIGLVDRIFTRIGAQDEIHAGQSTFMVEMVETANILHHATNRSLLVLDEIGRGTSTYDGLSIAWAVIEYIHNHPDLRAKTLFATHYHELTQLSDLLPGVRNYNVAVSEADGEVVFLHKIVPGGADRSYGIHVGQLAGLPKSVIQRAEEILKELEATSGNTTRMDGTAAKQVALFPETNPLLDELGELDMNELSPIEALNKMYEWQKRYLESKKGK
ncbi:MAG: DNA mismatch repair protein MutS [Chloroflexi bacterium]|nr:MAG: DNA mismatch repair protein MutS [Chloroflexota bacterium]MBL1195883.1 DNA mismatch repair protein MutS [Chloroflexota bacterium]NOH13175.1 DNA mismatch repair protein MutS [Chloroflexota bacterium]